MAEPNMVPMPDPDLLAELDAADCWCGRDPVECEEAGGCSWTRTLADREREVRQQIAEEILADQAAHEARYAPVPGSGAVRVTRRQAMQRAAKIARGGPDA